MTLENEIVVLDTFEVRIYRSTAGNIFHTKSVGICTCITVHNTVNKTITRCMSN